jgi:hypothetical protein
MGSKTMAALARGMFAVAVVATAAACANGGGSGAGSAAPTTPAKLFADDFRGACKGATVSRATPYQATAPSHKTILFSPSGDHLVEDTGTLPSDWMVQFDANSDAYAGVDTVVCEELESDQPIKECTGYQDDGRDTNDKVDLRAATYAVSVHEATTGNELGRTELTGDDDDCPMFLSFDDDDQTKVYDAPPSKDDVVAFVKPFVQR